MIAHIYVYSWTGMYVRILFTWVMTLCQGMIRSDVAGETWYPVLQGSVGHIRFAIFKGNTTLLPNSFKQCCIPDKRNPHTQSCCIRCLDC